MNWRLILVVVFSVAVHLTLLSIRFQPNGRVVQGERNLVGLVSDPLAKFTPADTSDDIVHSAKQELVHRQSQSLSVAQNIPSSLQPLSVSPLIATQAETVVTEVFEIESAEVVTQDPAPQVSAKTMSMSNVLVAKNPLIENTTVGPVAGFDPGPASRRLQSVAVAKQIAPLVNAVPRYADNPSPRYPEVARRKGWTGEVRLLVLVDKVGEVENISISRSSGYSALDRAARRAVRLWRFTPAIEAGRKIASEVVIPIDFRLPGSGRSDLPKQQ